MLNELYTKFDSSIDKHKVYKVHLTKTLPCNFRENVTKNQEGIVKVSVFSNIL